MDARRVHSTSTDRSNSVLCDQRIMLIGYYSVRKYPASDRALIAIVKKELHWGASLYIGLQILSALGFEETQL